MPKVIALCLIVFYYYFNNNETVNEKLMTTIRSAKDVQFKDAIIDMKLSYKGASYDEAKGKFIDKIKQVTVSKIDKTKTGRITLWVVQDGDLHSCKLFQNGPANPERFIFI